MATRPFSHRERVILGPLLDRLEQQRRETEATEDAIQRVLAAMGLDGAVLDPEWRTLDVKVDPDA